MNLGKFFPQLHDKVQMEIVKLFQGLNKIMQMRKLSKVSRTCVQPMVVLKSVFIPQFLLLLYYHRKPVPELRY